MINKSKKRRFLFLQTLFLFMILSVYKVEAADIDYIAPEESTLIQSASNSLLRISSEGGEVGVLNSQVYYNGDVYTYVLELTPSVDSVPEFNLGLLPDEPLISSGYESYGYDFVQAANAVAQYGSGTHPLSGDDIFFGDLDPDNTIDWLMNPDYSLNYYYWQSGMTITFFFEHKSKPVEGFYNFGAGSNSASAVGYVPAPVPIPGTFLLMGSSLLMAGIIKRKKIK